MTTTNTQNARPTLNHAAFTAASEAFAKASGDFVATWLPGGNRGGIKSAISVVSAVANGTNTSAGIKALFESANGDSFAQSAAVQLLTKAVNHGFIVETGTAARGEGQRGRKATTYAITPDGSAFLAAAAEIGSLLNAPRREDFMVYPAAAAAAEVSTAIVTESVASAAVADADSETAEAIEPIKTPRNRGRNK